MVAAAPRPYRTPGGNPGTNRAGSALAVRAGSGPAMMRGVPRPGARGPGLRALAGAGLCVPAASGVIIERVRQQVERIRTLVQACDAEMPRALLEGWQRLSGWSGCSASPDRCSGGDYITWT